MLVEGELEMEAFVPEVMCLPIKSADVEGMADDFLDPGGWM